MPGRLTILLTVEAFCLGLLRLATDVRFDWFAFFDGGAELTVHMLMRRGLQPTLDFGFIYGLLPLTFGTAWYQVFGLTPVAFACQCLLGGVLTAWGLARVLESLQVGWVGLVWIMVVMPIGLVTAAAPSLTHVMEPIFLTHALAELAAGRRSRALALASLCIFVKPSMAFLLAGTIVVGSFLDNPRQTRRSWLKTVLPAFLVLTLLFSVLLRIYGLSVLLKTLFPASGYAVYKQNGFGFVLGSGRLFWLPDRPRFAFYIDTVAGFWLAANLVLMVSAIRHIVMRFHRLNSLPIVISQDESNSTVESRLPTQINERRSEIIVICALLHLAFVCLFFGNRWSWVYYFNFLAVGLAAVSPRDRATRVAVLVLTLIALPSAARSVRSAVEGWSGRTRSDQTLGLWASPTAREEWLEVKRLTHNLHPVLLATTDGAALLDHDFTPPEVSFLVRGHLLASEFARKRAQVRSASAIVVANPAPGDPWFDEWPEFRDDLKAHRLAWSCSRLRVYLALRDAESTISSKNSR